MSKRRHRGRNVKGPVASRVDGMVSEQRNSPVLSIGKKLGTIVAQGPDAKLNKLGQVATEVSEKVGRKLVGEPFPVPPGMKAENMGDYVAVSPEDEHNFEVQYRHEDKTPEQIRQVAVRFYQSTISACVNGLDGINLAIGTNPVDRPWPECLEPQSVITAAIETIDRSVAHPDHKHRNLTAKEKQQWRDTLYNYIGTVFFTKLREARIFQFKGRDYGQFYRYADQQITLECGYKWEPADSPREVPDEERKVTAEYTIAEGAKQPFPEKLPFKSSYFAWGVGVPVVQMPVLHEQYGLNPENVSVIMATLVCDDGWVFTILAHYNPKQIHALNASPALAVAASITGMGTGVKHNIIVERIGDHDFSIEGERQKIPHHETLMNPGWILPYSLAPWIVNYTIEIINRQDSLTKVQPGSLKERLIFKALSKRTGSHFLPAPYYTVIIQPQIYDEIQKRIESQPRKWSHQWDVMGHYAHKVARGTLPIDPKVIWKLQKRKYEFFHALHRPSPEVMEFLMRKRVLPPRTGEWLALLTFHRDAYIKGPKDKPYVPSVRRLKGGVPPVA